MVKKKIENILLVSWIEELQSKWDSEEYYYDTDEAVIVPSKFSICYNSNV